MRKEESTSASGRKEKREGLLIICIANRRMAALCTAGSAHFTSAHMACNARSFVVVDTPCPCTTRHNPIQSKRSSFKREGRATRTHLSEKGSPGESGASSQEVNEHLHHPHLQLPYMPCYTHNNNISIHITLQQHCSRAAAATHRWRRGVRGTWLAQARWQQRSTAQADRRQRSTICCERARRTALRD